MSVLEIEGLRKSYRAVRAVQGVSLRVGQGETVALLGPNGSGKTSVLRCVAGLLRPDAGAIRVCGRELGSGASCAARAPMAYLPQQASFPGHATVREVLQLHAALRGVARARVAQTLAEAGLEPSLLGRSAGELSLGMRHRLALAVAQLSSPQLLVLDEPTASLDPAAALAFRERARRWRAEGRAVLLATHVLADAEELADRVVVLIEGKVASDEPVAALRERLQRRAVLRVVVEAPGAAHLAAARAAGASEVRVGAGDLVVTAPAGRRFAILERLAQLGPVKALQTEEPSLESVYLDFVGGADESRNV